MLLGEESGLTPGVLPPPGAPSRDQPLKVSRITAHMSSLAGAQAGDQHITDSGSGLSWLRCCHRPMKDTPPLVTPGPRGSQIILAERGPL